MANEIPVLRVHFMEFFNGAGNVSGCSFAEQTPGQRGDEIFPKIDLAW